MTQKKYGNNITVNDSPRNRTRDLLQNWDKWAQIPSCIVLVRVSNVDYTPNDPFSPSRSTLKPQESSPEPLKAKEAAWRMECCILKHF